MLRRARTFICSIGALLLLYNKSTAAAAAVCNTNILPCIFIHTILRGVSVVLFLVGILHYNTAVQQFSDEKDRLQQYLYSSTATATA